MNRLDPKNSRRPIPDRLGWDRAECERCGDRMWVEDIRRTPHRCEACLRSPGAEHVGTHHPAVPRSDRNYYGDYAWKWC